MSLEKLLKEAFEPPLASQMRFLTMIQQPFGIPPEPKLTKEAAYGLSKIAQILGQEPSEESSLQLQRAAMVDPQIQQALDFQQAQAEREEALAQVEQMNQQLFEAQSAQAAAEQQAQQAGQQAAQVQEQLAQEQAARQETQAQLIAARDQSLQEQMGAQEQKIQMNQSAEIFQQQANMLAQQLKAMSMQPTGQGPAAMQQQQQQMQEQGAEGLPPPMTAGAAQEQQQAANAEQEAGIQGQQAQVATEEDMAKQEQMAAMQGGQPQPGSPEEQAMMEQQMAAQGGQPQPGSPEEQAMMAQQQGGMPPEAMPKQGSDVRAMYQRAMLKMAGLSGTDKDKIQAVSKSMKATKGMSVPERKTFMKGVGKEIPNQQKPWSEAKKVSARAGGAVGKALRTLGINAGVVKEKAKPHVQGAKETAQEFKGSMKREMEKGGQLLAIPIQHAPQHLDPRTAAREGAIRGLAGGGLLGGALGVAAGMRGSKASLLRGALGGLGGAVVGGSALGIAGGGLNAAQAALNRDRMIANLRARRGITNKLRSEFAAEGQPTKQASFQEIIGNPKIQGAVIGAAIGALGGAGAGAVPGTLAGTATAPSGERGSGAMKGTGRGMIGGALAGAAGGALVGATIGGGKAGQQWGRLVGGGALMLSAPGMGALAAGAGGLSDRSKKRTQNEEDRKLRQLLPENQMPKAASASDVARRIMAQKGIGVLVGAGAGAGYGGIEAGLERKTPEGQPTDKQIDLQVRSEAAKIKAELDPTFLNKMKALKADSDLKTEDVLRKHPGGRIAWRAGQGAIVGGLGEGAVRTMAEPAMRYGSALVEGGKKVLNTPLVFSAKFGPSTPHLRRM